MGQQTITDYQMDDAVEEIKAMKAVMSILLLVRPLRRGRKLNVISRLTSCGHTLAVWSTPREIALFVIGQQKAVGRPRNWDIVCQEKLSEILKETEEGVEEPE